MQETHAVTCQSLRYIVQLLWPRINWTIHHFLWQYFPLCECWNITVNCSFHLTVKMHKYVIVPHELACEMALKFIHLFYMNKLFLHSHWVYWSVSYLIWIAKKKFPYTFPNIADRYREAEVSRNMSSNSRMLSTKSKSFVKSVVMIAVSSIFLVVHL